MHFLAFEITSYKFDKSSSLYFFKFLLEFVERDTNKVLIVGFADVDALLASAKVAKNDSSDIVLEGILHDIFNGKIEKVVYAIIPSLAQGYQIVCIFCLSIFFPYRLHFAIAN